MLKNVTVTLPEDTLRVVRIAAATQGLSMSKWLGQLIERTVQNESAEAIAQKEAERIEGQRVALARFLALPKASVPLTDENGMAPSKEWMNDREGLRGYKHTDLRAGPDLKPEDQTLRSVAEPTRPFWTD